VSGTQAKGAAWTPERLTQLSKSEVENLRANAIRLSASELVAKCDEELGRRAPPKNSPRSGQRPSSSGDVVTGYHFVCANDRGVTPMDDGCFRSGSWVVSEDRVRQSIEYGAYLALHESKAVPSYRQGRILNYARTPRAMVDGEQPEGIEFLVEATNEAYEWVGTGAGEKGYRWEKFAGAPVASDRTDGEDQ